MPGDETITGYKTNWRVLCHADSNRFYAVELRRPHSWELSNGERYLEIPRVVDIALSSDGSKLALNGTRATGFVDIIETQSGERA